MSDVFMTQHYDYVLESKAIGDAGAFEGYGSTFGNVDQGGDIVEKGAFAESLLQAKADGRVIPMLWQHKQDMPIGIWTDVAEDKKGLFVRGQLLIDDVPKAREAYGLLKAGALGGMSIGYGVSVGGAIPDAKRRDVTRLVKLDLREVSLVTMPMNVAAKVTGIKAEVQEFKVRLAAGERLTSREWDKLLKEAFGLSNSEAERAVRVNLKGQGEPDAKATNPDFWAALAAQISNP